MGTSSELNPVYQRCSQIEIGPDVYLPESF